MSQKLTRAYPLREVASRDELRHPFRKKTTYECSRPANMCNANFGDEQGHLEAKSRERLISGGHGF